jgi:hypothetical protein
LSESKKGFEWRRVCYSLEYSLIFARINGDAVNVSPCFSKHRAMKTYAGERFIVQGNRVGWRRVVSFLHRKLYVRINCSPLPYQALNRRLGEPQR